MSKPDALFQLPYSRVLNFLSERSSCCLLGDEHPIGDVDRGNGYWSRLHKTASELPLLVSWTCEGQQEAYKHAGFNSQFPRIGQRSNRAKCCTRFMEGPHCFHGSSWASDWSQEQRYQVAACTSLSYALSQMRKKPSPCRFPNTVFGERLLEPLQAQLPNSLSPLWGENSEKPTSNYQGSTPWFPAFWLDPPYGLNMAEMPRGGQQPHTL